MYTYTHLHFCIRITRLHLSIWNLYNAVDNSDRKTQHNSNKTVTICVCIQDGALIMNRLHTVLWLFSILFAGSTLIKTNRSTVINCCIFV